MSKTIQNARNFFKDSVQVENTFTEGFESVGSIQTPTISIPLTFELTEQERLSIQKIIVDDYKPGLVSEDQVSHHIEQLLEITKQIKSISGQSVLLHGERILQAQRLLANYKEGAFSKWLISTYGNRQTPYSMLRYYEFYQGSTKEAQKIIDSVPKKVMYLLASREGDERKKLEFIQKHGNVPQSDLLLLLQSTFPTAGTSTRKPLLEATISTMHKLCSKLEARSEHISGEDKIEIKKLIHRLQQLGIKDG